MPTPNTKKMLSNLERDRIETEFQNRFGEGGRLFFAPSRINIIGEHIDYNGGKVLPCAIEIGTYGMAKKNDLNTLRLYSINMEYGKELIIDDLSFRDDRDWCNYITGMAKYIREEGFEIGGIDMVVYGNIPNGAGLSSSASLEMLIGEVFNVLYNDGKIPRVLMSLLGQSTENEHIGLNTGIMDQFAISLGKKDNAIYLDTSNLEYEYIPVDLKEKTLVILNTNKRRELKDSKYNERRAECEEGLRILKQHIYIDNLCELEPTFDTYNLIKTIDDPVIINRVTHVIEENDRVKQMLEAMREEDYEKMGRLLDASHESLKDLYEVTGHELDSIVEAARASEYTLGARMTGAGFSGCAIALIEKSGMVKFEETVKEIYKEKTGLDAEVIVSKIDDGPREVL